MNNELKAEYLDFNKPFVKKVKYQNFYTCSILSPNSFPIEHRHKAKNQEVYGFKFHGVYEKESEQEEHSEKLRNQLKNYEILGDQVGVLIEFDVDLSDSNRNSRIIYKEEEQNEINERQFKKELCKKYVEPEEKLDFSNFNTNPIQDDNVDLEKYFNEDKDRKFEFSINQANYACVTFYKKEDFKNIPDNFKDKKIVAHKVHGFFEKLKDAQRFVVWNKKIYPLMFIFQVGYWCAFDINLINNSIPDNSLMIKRNNMLNDFMKLYLDSLELSAMEEKTRKDDYLKDSTVVTSECEHLRKMNNNNIVNETNTNDTNDETDKKEEVITEEGKITEEEKINKKLEEIRIRREQLNERLNNNTMVTEEEMEEKFERMKKLYERLK